MPALLALLLPMAPGLIQAAMQIFQTASQAAETSAEQKVHYARIAASLDAVDALVQAAPLPPVGSGA